MKRLISLLGIFCFAVFYFQITFAQPQQQLNIRMLEAAKNNKADSVKYWLDKGANVNCFDNSGLSPLDYYIKNLSNQLPILLEYGAFTNGTQTIEIAEKVRDAVFTKQDPKHPDYATALNNLAILSEVNGDYSKAEPLFIQALQIRKEVFGGKHPEYAASLNNLAHLYYNQGDYQKAEPLYAQALQIRKDIFGVKHPDFATSLNNLAILYMFQGNYSKAESLYNQALQIRKEVQGEKQPAFARTLLNLATLYWLQGNYAKAESLYIKSLQTTKEVLGVKHINYALALENLAILYDDQGNYAKAEPLYIQAQKIRKQVQGENHPDYARNICNLAILYHNQGNYSKAEPLYIKALQIRKEKLGENHPDYANSIHSLASLYNYLGNYSKAEQLYILALTITKKTLGDKHPNYAALLSNLAALSSNQENCPKAESLYIQALQIRKETLGEKHPHYAMSLDNLASFYTNQGDYFKAEPLYIQAMQIKKEVLGEKHPDYAETLNNLAILYANQGRYSKSEQLYIQALQIREKTLGVKHPDYVISLNNLAILYDLLDKLDNEEPLILQSSSINYENILLSFSFLSETERDKYLKTNDINFLTYKTFAYSYYSQKPSISTFAYNNELFSKGILLNTSQEIQRSITQSGDTTLISTLNKMKEIRKRINFLESQPKEKQFGLPELEEEANQLDKILTQKSQAYRQAQSEQQIKWQDVQAKLKEGEAAIEFSSFRYFHKEWTDSTLYCALVLKKGMEHPVMVPLCEQKQLDSLFVGDKAAPNMLYASRGVTGKYKAKQPNGQKLYKLIWQPLEKELQDVKTVYYSPSGSLHQISFAALPTDSAHYLCDQYNLVQLSSTRQLATSTWQANPSQITSTALFGGIKYDLEGQEVAELQRSLPTNELAMRGFTSDSTRNSKSFGFLEGTKKEVESISANLTAKHIKTTLYTGINGNEESFKSLSNQNISVLHIATHGFFYPDEQQNPDKLDQMMLLGEQKFKYVPNPLLRSGLILAGGNRAWKGEEPISGMQDGILTAQEISEMNLQNTELVVLSACETGLGDIKGGEGVFGLQRAFKLAGVKTIIMSLWKVPDAETSELMQSFYQKWLAGMDKHDAFRLAQQEIKSKRPEPYFWAGFVMVD